MLNIDFAIDLLAGILQHVSGVRILQQAFITWGQKAI